MKTKKDIELMIEPAAESDYDSAWKDVIEKLFEQFLEFFFPHIHQDIDFAKGGRRPPRAGPDIIGQLYQESFRRGHSQAG